MTPTRSLLAAALLTTLAAAAGCGSDGAAPAPSPPPSTTQAPVVPPATAKATPRATTQSGRYCVGLLSRADVSTLAGVTMGGVSVQAVGNTPGCLWRGSGRGSKVVVAVVNASSSTWAQQLPAVVAGVRSSGAVIDSALEAQLAEARGYLRRKQEVDADLACEIFSGLATATGSNPGADATLRVTPDPGNADSITAQVCNSDEYSFVKLTDPALRGDQAAVTARTEAIRAALQQVQGAPITF